MACEMRELGSATQVERWVGPLDSVERTLGFFEAFEVVLEGRF